MPSFTDRFQPSNPKYRRHKPSGQAVVTLNGTDFYLGPYGTKASRLEYDRTIGEWLARGRQVPKTAAESGTLTVNEIIARYWRFAEGYYVKDGKPSKYLGNLRPTLGILRRMYGHTFAADFGPLALQAIQAGMVADGHSRAYCNMTVDRIRRVFKWATSQQLLDVSIYQALTTVAGLRKGKTVAPESRHVRPAADALVQATIPLLPTTVADMVRLQGLTGARPGEICPLRPCDVDTTGDVWAYRPESHKTENYGRERVIPIGPKAQEVLRPYLLRDKSAYCFVPAESERHRNAERRENRQTPMTPSQAKRRPKRNRRRPPGQCYSTNAYCRAVHRACRLAFPTPKGLTAAEQVQWRKDHDWSPNQLRHSVATEVRRRFGLEAAQVVLGHSRADITQVYAERDLTLATEVMREVG